MQYSKNDFIIEGESLEYISEELTNFSCEIMECYRNNNTKSYFHSNKIKFIYLPCR